MKGDDFRMGRMMRLGLRRAIRYNFANRAIRKGRVWLLGN
jgi:hypothetical protein